MKYSDEAIQSALILLDNMTVRGIEDAKRVVMIDNILRTPMEEKHDGKNSV